MKTEILKLSKCCNSDVRYNGLIGLIDYGYTCNHCDRKCNIVQVEKIKKYGKTKSNRI
jgi:hypothetical protein